MTNTKLQFRCGARVIPAPIPNGTLDENVKQLSVAYPFFRFTTVLPSDVTILADGTREACVVMPPAKTNG